VGGAHLGLPVLPQRLDVEELDPDVHPSRHHRECRRSGFRVHGDALLGQVRHRRCVHPGSPDALGVEPGGGGDRAGVVGAGGRGRALARYFAAHRGQPGRELGVALQQRSDRDAAARGFGGDRVDQGLRRDLRVRVDLALAGHQLLPGDGVETGGERVGDVELGGRELGAGAHAEACEFGPVGVEPGADPLQRPLAQVGPVVQLLLVAAVLLGQPVVHPRRGPAAHGGHVRQGHTSPEVPRSSP
jgi:hypothetical protein